MCEKSKPDAILRGLATHKALSLLPLRALKELFISSSHFQITELRQLIEKELNSIQQKGSLSSEECQGIDLEMLVRFFSCDLGARVLLADAIHREWGFTLYAPNLCDSLLQGVIDLCFLENNEWVLVDYKTDHVQSAADLWTLYKEQIQIYKYALNQCTPYQVRETALFSLTLGEAYSEMQ